MFNVPAEKPNAFAGAADLSEVDLSAPNLKLMIATRVCEVLAYTVWMKIMVCVCCV
jgi:hypothetical protein